MAVVVVTDAEQRAALAVVRSLGRAGHTVHVTSQAARALAGESRFAASTTMVPDPMRDPVACAAAHARLAARLGAQVLIPVGEASALALLEHPPADVRIPMTDLATFRLMCDKAAVLDAAQRVGLRVPSQYIIESKSTFTQESAAREVARVPMPAVIKPSRSVAGPGGAQIKLPVRYVSDIGDVRRVVEDTPESAFPLLLQERAKGSGLGVFHLLWEGQEVATFAHRRLREKPPSGGVSTYRESIELPPELHQRSRELLAALGMTHGVAMVEFKAEAGEVPVLMEINARFWGSLQLAIDAGVDFPSLLTQLALGDTPAPVTTWTPGVRSRWFWGDIDHLIARVRRRVDARGNETTRVLWPAVRDVLLAPNQRREEEIFRTNDPRPFLLETRNWFARR